MESLSQTLRYKRCGWGRVKKTTSLHVETIRGINEELTCHEKGVWCDSGSCVTGDHVNGRSRWRLLSLSFSLCFFVSSWMKWLLALPASVEAATFFLFCLRKWPGLRQFMYSSFTRIVSLDARDATLSSCLWSTSYSAAALPSSSSSHASMTIKIMVSLKAGIEYWVNNLLCLALHLHLKWSQHN